MIGVDTNILVRAALEDDPKQAGQAQSLLKRAAETKMLFVPSYAILEMVWVLKGENRTRGQIVDAIFSLLDSPGVQVGQREVVLAAIEKYKKGSADFGDYMILAESESNGAHQLASFDKQLTRELSSCKPPSEILKTL
jgi:predicted nucleic-acid-binding protein